MRCDTIGTAQLTGVHAQAAACCAMQYRYFVFLFLITAQAVITCQYDPFAAPGYHGEVRLDNRGPQHIAGSRTQL